MSGPFLPISSRGDGGIDIRIHSEQRLPTCQALGEVSSNSEEWDDNVGPPCEGCAYVPGHDRAKLIQGDELDSSVWTVVSSTESLIKHFPRIYLDVDFTHNLDPAHNFAANVRERATRSSHEALARIVTLLGPTLQGKVVNLTILNVAVRADEAYYRTQLSIFASLRCQLTVLDVPVHAQQIVQQIQTEVNSDAPKRDLFQQHFELGQLPALNVREAPFRLPMDRLFDAALARDFAAFIATRRQIVALLRQQHEDMRAKLSEMAREVKLDD